MQKRRGHITDYELGARDLSVPARKSLGQHFLNDKSYLRAVAYAADIAPHQTVVEIGPGKGSLTAELLARGARVIALEKDRRLIPLLEETFAAEISSGQLKVLEIDALEFDPGAEKIKGNAFKSPDSKALPFIFSPGYRMVGNIPYYITGALLQKFLTEKDQPSTIVFLVQKEVAERISRGPKESILSLSVKAYGTPKYIKTVPAGAFSPPPQVDSAIVRISGISRKRFIDGAHERRFFELVKAGFAHKRKLLSRNLEPLLGPGYPGILARAGIPPAARAEDVPLARWLALAQVVFMN